jgi:hypothetical protein
MGLMPPSHTRAAIAAKVRAYRERQVAAGNKELTLHLPADAVDYLDALKTELGLRNRSQALMMLIEQGREAIRQTA